MGRRDPGEGGGVEPGLRRWRGELKEKKKHNNICFLLEKFHSTVCWL